MESLQVSRLKQPGVEGCPASLEKGAAQRFLKVQAVGPLTHTAERSESWAGGGTAWYAGYFASNGGVRNRTSHKWREREGAGFPRSKTRTFRGLERVTGGTPEGSFPRFCAESAEIHREKHPRVPPDAPWPSARKQNRQNLLDGPFRSRPGAGGKGTRASQMTRRGGLRSFQVRGTRETGRGPRPPP